MNRHRFDPISFVAGLLFAGLGAAFLGGDVRFSTMDLTWLWPLAIMALGLALLAGVRNRLDSSEAKDDDDSATTAEGDV